MCEAERQTPQARDRRLQVFLAQARGPARNGDLLIDAIDTMLLLRAARGELPKEKVMDRALIETLTEVAQALDEEGVEYAVTGSIASSLHSEPYSSVDVDLILDASVEQAQRIARRLSPRFYAPEDMLAKAAQEHAFVNAVDNRTSLKADLSFVERRGYLARVLDRRIEVCVGSTGRLFKFGTAEDGILKKWLRRKDTRT